MKDTVERRVESRPDDRRASHPWTVYAAAAWAFLFAGISFYWAAGGTAGLGTLAESIQESAREGDPQMLALTWATGGLKLIAGMVALALVRPWGRRIPRWTLLVAAWGAGVVLAVYGAAGFVEMALIELGVLDIPDSMGSKGAVRWSLLLWKPFWLLGGILFLAAARGYQRDFGRAG